MGKDELWSFLEGVIGYVDPSIQGGEPAETNRT
jgi:hypothetical protein